jgi:hypothetical protein
MQRLLLHEMRFELDAVLKAERNRADKSVTQRLSALKVRPRRRSIALFCLLLHAVALATQQVSALKVRPRGGARCGPRGGAGCGLRGGALSASFCILRRTSLLS